MSVTSRLHYFLMWFESRHAYLPYRLKIPMSDFHALIGEFGIDIKKYKSFRFREVFVEGKV